MLATNYNYIIKWIKVYLLIFGQILGLLFRTQIGQRMSKRENNSGRSLI
jgi:hypothetical protein